MTYYIILERKYGSCQGIYFAENESAAMDMMAVDGGCKDLAHEAELSGVSVATIWDEMSVQDIGWCIDALAATVVATDLECGESSAWTVEQLINVSHTAGITRRCAMLIGTFGAEALASAVIRVSRRAA